MYLITCNKTLAVAPRLPGPRLKTREYDPAG
jgi:hypothetical protein